MRPKVRRLETRYDSHMIAPTMAKAAISPWPTKS